MSAPDFYFAINALFRHLHDQYGKEALVEYWRQLGIEYYAHRAAKWGSGGAEVVAADWIDYFSREPQAQVEVHRPEPRTVELEIRVCPAIKHLRDNGRDIVPYFCEHCDHVTGAGAAGAGFLFSRTGGMGSCRQTFIQLTCGAAKLEQAPCRESKPAPARQSSPRDIGGG